MKQKNEEHEKRKDELIETEAKKTQFVLKEIKKRNHIII